MKDKITHSTAQMVTCINNYKMNTEKGELRKSLRGNRKKYVEARSSMTICHKTENKLVPTSSTQHHLSGEARG